MSERLSQILEKIKNCNDELEVLTNLMCDKLEKDIPIQANSTVNGGKTGK
ncbi:MAG: hypothetical protein ACM3WV_10170 [Bacillota bacterium]